MSNNSKPFQILGSAGAGLKGAIASGGLKGMLRKKGKGNKLPITKKPVKGIQLGQPGTQSGTSRSKKGY